MKHDARDLDTWNDFDDVPETVWFHEREPDRDLPFSETAYQQHLDNESDGQQGNPDGCYHCGSFLHTSDCCTVS